MRIFLLLTGLCLFYLFDVAQTPAYPPPWKAIISSTIFRSKLVTEHLGVNHLRLVMGTSMGAMHTWVWGYTYPDFMDALMPLASLPVASLDANDLIYQLESSRNYDPSPHLRDIKAPLFAINSADDQVNPPELHILDEKIKEVPKGRYILLPITDQTSGHGTHSNPAIWGNYLKELLEL